MAAADFILTPSVVFSEDNAGGIGGALGGLIGGNRGRAIAGVAGGVKFKQAETNLLMADSRSGIQVASAQGSAQATDSVGGGCSAASRAGAVQQHGLGNVSSLPFRTVTTSSATSQQSSLVQAPPARLAAERGASTAPTPRRWRVMLPTIAGSRCCAHRERLRDVQTLTATTIRSCSLLAEVFVQCRGVATAG